MGEVRDAVLEVVRAANEPLRPVDVRDLVSERLGRTIAWSSVKAALNAATHGGHVARLDRGVYVAIAFAPSPSDP
jgi:hypothetical protein